MRSILAHAGSGSRAAFASERDSLEPPSAAPSPSRARYPPNSVSTRCPPTVKWEACGPPSIRCPMASSACIVAVRPKRASHAFGSGSEFSTVPVASPSAMYAPAALESLSPIVSSPSSCESSSSVTETVPLRSPTAKVSVPLAAS